jgi:hypothetical protein
VASRSVTRSGRLGDVCMRLSWHVVYVPCGAGGAPERRAMVGGAHRPAPAHMYMGRRRFTRGRQPTKCVLKTAAGEEEHYRHHHHHGGGEGQRREGGQLVHACVPRARSEAGKQASKQASNPWLVRSERLEPGFALAWACLVARAAGMQAGRQAGRQSDRYRKNRESWGRCRRCAGDKGMAWHGIAWHSMA